MKASLIARVIHIVANGILIILLANYLLEPGGYGRLFLAIAIINLAQLFADLGIARSAARYVTEYKESDPSQITNILKMSLKYRLVLIGIVCIAIIAGRGMIAELLNDQKLELLLLIGTGFITFKSLQQFSSAIFQGFNAVEYSAIIKTISSVSKVLFVVVFVTFGWKVVGALLGYVLSAGVTAAVGLTILYVRFYRNFDMDAACENGLGKRIVEYSIPLTATRSANVIDGRVDIILVGYFLNPVAVGFYTLGKQITEFIRAPAGSIGFAVSPTYGEQKANNSLDQAARVYELTLQYVLLLYIPASVGLMAVAKPMILLIFGRAYLGAVPVIQILSVFLLFQAVTGVTTQGIDYLGRARYRAVAKGTTSIANFGLNIILIPTIGVVGAAGATVITYGIYTILNVYIMYIELPLRIGYLTKMVGGTTIISAIMGGAVVLLLPYVSGYLSLGAIILFGVLIWAGLASVSGLLDIQEAITYLSRSS
ncbi:flippase [Natronoarchaeum sp. GCM10025703]|uniref:flippase n=1 Tax=unclassified Natronoarchaeum TaxID=2620183 RepID=UPI0036142C94